MLVLPAGAIQGSLPIGVGAVATGVVVEALATKVFWVSGLGTPHPESPPQRLVTRGPYRYSRNPLYVGRLLMLLGFSLVHGSLGIALVTGGLLIVLQVRLVPEEERRLRGRFGDEYEAYRARVGRWLTIPRTRPAGGPPER